MKGDWLANWRGEERSQEWKVMGGDEGGTSSPWGAYRISRWPRRNRMQLHVSPGHHCCTRRLFTPKTVYSTGKSIAALWRMVEPQGHWLQNRHLAWAEPQPHHALTVTPHFSLPQCSALLIGDVVMFAPAHNSSVKCIGYARHRVK